MQALESEVQDAREEAPSAEGNLLASGASTLAFKASSSASGETPSSARSEEHDAFTEGQDAFEEEHDASSEVNAPGTPEKALPGQSIETSSMSKMSPAFGGIFGGLPLAP